MYFDLSAEALPGAGPRRDEFFAMHDFFRMNKRTLSAKLDHLRRREEESESHRDLFDDARLVGNYRQWRLPEDFFNSFFYELNKPARIDWLAM